MGKFQNLLACVLLPASICSLGYSVFTVREALLSTKSKEVYDKYYQDGFDEGSSSLEDLQQELDDLAYQKNALLNEINIISNELSVIDGQISELESLIDTILSEQQPNQDRLMQLQSQYDLLLESKTAKESELQELKDLYDSKKQEDEFLVVYMVEDRVGYHEIVSYNDHPTSYIIEDTETRRFSGWTDLQGNPVDPASQSITENTTYVAQFTYGYKMSFTYEAYEDLQLVTKTESSIVFEDEKIVLPTLPTLPEEYTKDYVGGWVVAGTREFIDPSILDPSQEYSFEYIYKMDTWNVTKENTFGSQTVDRGESVSFYYNTLISYYRETLDLQYVSTIELTLNLDIRDFSDPVGPADIIGNEKVTFVLKNNNGVFKTFVKSLGDRLKIFLKSTSDRFIFTFENTNIDHMRYLPYTVSLKNMIVHYEV